MKKLSIFPYRAPMYLLLASCAVIFYVYSTPPFLSPGKVNTLGIFMSLPGDLPVYSLRFLSSFLLFGLLPILFMLILGDTPYSLGIRKPLRYWKLPYIAGGVAISVVFGVVSSFHDGIFHYYPYSHTLADIVQGGAYHLFLIHTLLYLLLYYLPWEIFFRGMLILPFLPEEGQDEDLNPRILGIAFFQVIPSSLLHFGHPFIETLSAVPFGIVAGYLVLRTRSIFPGLLLHFVIGITVDLSIIIQGG